MISIIMPAYNAEKYLQTAIDSLTKQTRKEFELVIVNDGSTDDTALIVQENMGKDLGFCIRLINQDNQGQFRSRQRGIAEAKGSYVMFLDADDSLREDAVQLLTDSIKEYCVDCILYNAYRVTEKSMERFWSPLAENLTIFDKENKMYLYKKILEGNSLNNLWLKCFKKLYADDIPEINRRVNVEEDLAQFLPVIDKAERIIYLDECLYYYRENTTSITAKFNINHFYATTEVSILLERYAKKWNQEELYSLQTIRYIDNIYGSIMQLVNKNCPLTLKQKCKYLFDCADNPYFLRKFEEYKGLTKINQKLILFNLIKSHHMKYALLFGNLICIVRGH